MQKQARQLNLLKKQSKAYGGELLKTRKGRAHGRPLATKSSMHLVLRSSQAKGVWSFHAKGNAKKIHQIILKFAHKYGIKIISLANVGNHLHLQIQLSNRFGYRPFIRAITSAIMIAITGKTRWSSGHRQQNTGVRQKFWDYRPFTRVIIGWRAFLGLKDYIELNKWEGFGFDRQMSRLIIAVNRTGLGYYGTG